MNEPLNPVLPATRKSEFASMVVQKHPGAICIANYKGGVGKTTLTCLLGYYLAKELKKKVLLIDVDPQCSLSLALGYDPDDVSKTELTIYNLVKPSKWTGLARTNFDSYISKPKDPLAPRSLRLIKGSFDVENLDIEIVKSLMEEDENRRTSELFLYVKQLMNAYSDFDYILVDTPPNKMYLTQAMLRACSYFLPVTIPDQISIYGMPRLLRWVNNIPEGERPALLGYVLNALNRSGRGQVNSQRNAEVDLRNSVSSLANRGQEKKILAQEPCLGKIPRLDAVARFLNSQDSIGLRVPTSRQPTVEECMQGIVSTLLRRIGEYNA